MPVHLIHPHTLLIAHYNASRDIIGL